MNRRIISILLVSFSLFAVSSFAEVKDAGFENKHTLRVDVRNDDDDYSLYLTRICGYVDYNFSLIERVIRFVPFFEYQANLDTNTWWRKEVGLEVGTDFFDGILYCGASFQHVWQKEENYSVEKLEETTEWESRFVITPPIYWWIFNDRVKLRLFEEYTYDFTRGQGTFNEVGLILDWQVFEWLKVPIGFRHTDRVHDFDADTLELSVLFSF